MGVQNILNREQELLDIIWPRLENMPGLHVLADNIKKRLGVVSFYIEGLHYNLGVKLLNDRFGIQVRGGCSCAGTYGHYLLEVSQQKSKHITDCINKGDLTKKPGWIRMSVHPITTNEEIHYILNAIEQLCLHHTKWAQDYEYICGMNEYRHKHFTKDEREIIAQWFTR